MTIHMPVDERTKKNTTRQPTHDTPQRETRVRATCDFMHEKACQALRQLRSTTPNDRPAFCVASLASSTDLTCVCVSSHRQNYPTTVTCDYQAEPIAPRFNSHTNVIAKTARRHTRASCCVGVRTMCTRASSATDDAGTSATRDDWLGYTIQ